MSLTQGGRDQTMTRYSMTVVPKFWLLTQCFQSRIFQQISVPDILRKVLTGLDVEYLIQGTFEPRDYCVQYPESDFHFAARLMEEEGIYYFFKFT
jgi:type VI secretion system secreted protein VgrG